MSISDQLDALGVEIGHHWAEDELYSKRTLVPAGVTLAKHVHSYDHASALVRGTVMLEVDGVSTEVTGPKMLFVEAGHHHRITSITEVVWHCIHITSETDETKIDEALTQ